MAAKRKKDTIKIQFAFVLTEEERDALLEVAKAEDRSAASWVRQQIRAAHAKLKKGNRR